MLVSINVILLECSQAHLFTYYLRLPLQWQTEYLSGPQAFWHQGPVTGSGERWLRR